MLHKLFSAQECNNGLWRSKGTQNRKTDASAPIVAASILEYPSIAVESGKAEALSLQRDGGQHVRARVVVCKAAFLNHIDDDVPDLLVVEVHAAGTHIDQHGIVASADFVGKLRFRRDSLEPGADICYRSSGPEKGYDCVCIPVPGEPFSESEFCSNIVDESPKIWA